MFVTALVTTKCLRAAGVAALTAGCLLGDPAVASAAESHARPTRIFAPVFEAYTGGNLGVIARQARALYPRLTSAKIWRKLAFTMMPGIDDYPGKTEVTRLSDARAMMNFAQARQMNSLSIWALERDNGDCPGVADAATCSGIQQQPWAFSHLLKRFASRSWPASQSGAGPFDWLW